MASIAQDTADFAKLRTNGCIYVDKTASLHELICDPGRSLYFISRPRRFGKSLMLSTLDCIFQGRRDLFKGLAIDSLDYDWADYPILQFSFAGVKATSLEAFKAEFHVRVKKVLTEAQCAWDDAISPGANLNQAITDLAKMRGKPVVILIDEYDAPVGHALADIPLATAIRGELSDFYIQIKECASNVRFLMMTGVTRFTPLSVFSALNNLNDLTMDARYATLLGYTEEELGTFFDADMRAHAQVMGLAYDDYRAQLRWWYNGYRFAKSNMVRVYNPYAIAKTLGAKDPLFSPTWTRSGHPSVLINYLSDHELTEVDYDDVENVSEESLDICQLEAITPVAMLYQSGYLTIKDYSEWGFTLGVPNEEVRRALNALLAQFATKKLGAGYRDTLCGLLAKGDVPGFIEKLKALYAHLTYGSTESSVHEASYQRPLYAILASYPGLRVIAEDAQAHGRADLVAESRRAVYVFELKVKGSAQEALAQIKDRGYAEPYRALGKPIHLIGLAFDPATHTLADALVEPLT